MTDQNKQPTISHYDPHLIPPESVARAKREGDEFGHVNKDPSDTEQLHTRSGYTVDQEGLINNYAVEPKMYINEPGDLDEEQGFVAYQKAANFKSLTQNEKGEVAKTRDWNNRGPGVI